MEEKAEPRVHHLNGVFITPDECLDWSKSDWRRALESISAAGMDTVVLQWTSASGRTLYPTKSDAPLPGMGVEDAVAVLLHAAETSGLSVILGLDATRYLGDIHYDPVEAQAARSARALLRIMLGREPSKALAGFYLPQEWSAPPTYEDAELMVDCASFCRRVLPGALVCTSVPRPRLPVTGHRWELEHDPQAAARERELLRHWALLWAQHIEAAQFAAVLLRDEVGALGWTVTGSEEAYRELRGACVGGDCELWAQVGLYDVARRAGDCDPPRLHPARMTRLRRQLRAAAPYCDRIIGFSFGHMDPAGGEEGARLYDDYQKYCGIQSPVTIPPRRKTRQAPGVDPLLEKAQAVERHIDARHLLEGQIMTVVNYQYPTEHPANQWQEDSDFLTGLYCGAQAMRFALTGEADAKARARRSFEALCMLSTISGIPGVVARCYRRTFEGGLGSGRKRWVKREGEDLWWAADISRDQLAGHFFGLAAYYDLVADESERKLIRRLMSDIAGSILDHRMQSVDWDGDYTIHGNFWVAPFQALAVLKTAHHITRERRFQEAYLDYINPHFFLGHAILQARAMLDPFYQHYQYDSPAYHLLQYETDPRLLCRLLRALDLLYADVKDLGNVYLYFVYQTYRPESDAARRGEKELREFNPDHLYRANWRKEVEKILAERKDELPWPLADTIRYCLQPEEKPRDHIATFVPMWLREPMEFNWQYYAGIQTPGRSGGTSPGGPHAGYAGVDYLLAYWMGRYHGFLR